MMMMMKMVVVLFWVQSGEGHWLRSLVDQKPGTASPHTSHSEDKRTRDTTTEHWQTEASGMEPSPPTIIPNNNSGFAPSWIPVRSRRSTSDSHHHCGLRSVLIQVRALGLGYDSDETVLFKYCGGSCPHRRSNHDLTLTNLLLSGALPERAAGEMWHHAPCCRPTHHEDMAFLDNSHRWHKVEQLSAGGCSCVG